MKFKGTGSTIVWDPERGRELCRFNKGQFESEDPRICRLLVKLGYEYKGEFPEEEKEIDEALIAMRARAKELKINNWHTMKAETLTEKIADEEENQRLLGIAIDRAVELGLEGFEEMNLEELQAAIAEAEKGD